MHAARTIEKRYGKSKNRKEIEQDLLIQKTTLDKKIEELENEH